jgi:hypothetical protein
MVTIIFTSIPNLNLCYCAFGNEIPVAFLLCKAISIPGDQEGEIQSLKSTKNFPFLLHPNTLTDILLEMQLK